MRRRCPGWELLLPNAEGSDTQGTQGTAGKLGSWGSSQTHPTCYGAVRHMTTGSIQRDCWTGVERTHQGFLPSNFRSSHGRTTHRGAVAGSFRSATWRKRATTWKTSPLSLPWSPSLAMRNPVTHGHLRSGSMVQISSHENTHTHVQICSMVLFQNLYDLHADNHNHTHTHMYPLVICYIAIENGWKWWFIDIYRGFSQGKWWFSIAMLVDSLATNRCKAGIVVESHRTLTSQLPSGREAQGTADGFYAHTNNIYIYIIIL